jgi:hypothetical protein
MFEARHINTGPVSSSFLEQSVYTVKNNTKAIEKLMNMTRNPRKSYSRISGFMIAKEDSDAKGILVTINSNSRMNNNGEDGDGDDGDNNSNNNNNNNNNNNIMTLLSANTRMPNVTITD